MTFKDIAMIDASTLETGLNTLRNADIYLIDLILKRYFNPSMKIMDAGCGMGRNIEYFLQAGYEVYGADISEDDVNYIRKRALDINPSLNPDNFRLEPVEKMNFEPESMDVVICNTVLHFARNEENFEEMLKGTWRLLKAGGIFFCRLATSIGIERDIKQIEGRRFLLPDGSQRFLADEQMLRKYTDELNAKFLEPLKTVNVHGMRCMTNWILKKGEK